MLKKLIFLALFTVSIPINCELKRMWLTNGLTKYRYDMDTDATLEDYYKIASSLTGLPLESFTIEYEIKPGKFIVIPNNHNKVSEFNLMTNDTDRLFARSAIFDEYNHPKIRMLFPLAPNKPSLESKGTTNWYLAKLFNPNDKRTIKLAFHNHRGISGFTTNNEFYALVAEHLEKPIEDIEITLLDDAKRHTNKILAKDNRTLTRDFKENLNNGKIGFIITSDPIAASKWPTVDTSAAAIEKERIAVAQKFISETALRSISDKLPKSLKITIPQRIKLLEKKILELSRKCKAGILDISRKESLIPITKINPSNFSKWKTAQQIAAAENFIHMTTKIFYPQTRIMLLENKVLELSRACTEGLE